MGFPLSFICSGHPMDRNKPHILLEPLKPVFCYLKSKIPLYLKENISGSMRKEDLLNDTIFNPGYFSLDYTFKGIIQ
jgi:hypothetical protein